MRQSPVTDSTPSVKVNRILFVSLILQWLYTRQSVLVSASLQSLATVVRLGYEPSRASYWRLQRLSLLKLSSFISRITEVQLFKIDVLLLANKIHASLPETHKLDYQSSWDPIADGINSVTSLVVWLDVFEAVQGGFWRGNMGGKHTWKKHKTCLLPLITANARRSVFFPLWASW